MTVFCLCKWLFLPGPPPPPTKVMTFCFACQLVPPDNEDFFLGGGVSSNSSAPLPKPKAPSAPPPHWKNPIYATVFYTGIGIWYMISEFLPEFLPNYYTDNFFWFFFGDALPPAPASCAYGEARAYPSPMKSCRPMEGHITLNWLCRDIWRYINDVDHHHHHHTVSVIVFGTVTLLWHSPFIPISFSFRENALSWSWQE